MSLVLQPNPLPVYRQFYLNAFISVGVCTVLRNYTGEDMKIKWPNDLYWQDRKAGGILIENILRAGAPGQASWRFAIAGIGININQHAFPDPLHNPVSIRQITGKEWDVLSIAKETCHAIDQQYQRFCQGGGTEILADYNSMLYRRNEYAGFRQGSRRFEARVEGVDPDGKLTLLHATTETFNSGELEWII
jgi:BirA family biotin operon repressor/biotin-[acetyl-CoA-carboxylase] ligase